MGIIVVIVLFAAFIGGLIWLVRNHIDTGETETEIKPEHVAMMGVVTNDPTLASVAYVVDPPEMVVDDGPDIVDIAIAESILMDDDTAYSEPVGDTPPPEDIGPYPEPQSVTEQVWEHHEADSVPDPPSIAESVFTHVEPDPEPASSSVVEETWTHSDPDPDPPSSYSSSDSDSDSSSDD